MWQVSAFFLVVGVIWIFASAWQTTSTNEFLDFFSTSIMTAGAALAVGGLIGFLFGVPRSVAGKSVPEDGQLTDSSGEKSPVDSYVPNTNLEQISDWLTKIIVGVSLVEAQSIAERLVALSDGIAGSVSGLDAEFVLSVIIYYVIAGFLIIYLWARLYLMGQLQRANKVERQLSQANIDRQAIGLSFSQMGQDAQEMPNADELNRTVKQASLETRRSINREASYHRWQAREGRVGSDKMEQIIPVLEALIDANDQDHYALAQLGYIYKDKPAPEWDKALNYLTRAISARGKSGNKLYEANRLVCLINNDPDFSNGLKTSNSTTEEKIRKDLDVLKKISDKESWLFQEPVVRRWQQLNAKAD